ncbi:putative bifunctional diguanylate cyclase/phosphodiesterase [Stutzerimonas frequens]|uniref:putative bifunctional diguanylate cyclase/phosphodiesterase n=1 Tax=Stutzerimonas frequens TaxID=2968969 RepID=UPI0022DD3A6E|nr:bifunctional diguanylate cyclase/phosphodiesterase [Stutzerimonas frequens]MDA0425992.1 EAL domain-containing protein [Stutzerimonas frequens]
MTQESSAATNRPGSLLSCEVLDRPRVLDTLVNNLEGMAYRCRNDAAWTMIFVSQGALGLCGYRAADLVDDACISWEQITHPDDRARVRRAVDAAIIRQGRFSTQYRIRTAAGNLKWVLERGVAVPNEQGEIVIEGFIEDISAQRAVLEALEQAELRYRSIFENASEGIFQSTRDGRYLAANPALARIYGYESATELVADLADIERRLYVQGGRREVFCQLMEQHGEVLNFESEVYRRDGVRIWISENAHVVRGANGEFICYEGTVQDISERKHYQQQLERQANHDLLTGLPNRILLNDRIDQGLARAARLGYYLTLVFIDLDNFKFINDGLGHVAGDELLKSIARRLAGCLRSSDTVARVGGDEFVLVLSDHYRVSTVISLLERVLNEIRRPVTLAGREFQIGASLGVAMFPDDGEDAQTLLKHADIAMYAAKKRGRNTFQFFIHDLNRVADERLNLEAAMRIALERDEFSVHYQPKVDSSCRIVGVEALARWTHHELGVIGPDRFIAVAEESGLIMPLTLAILRQAFNAARAWNEGRAVPLLIAVNLSPLLFLGDDVVERVAAVLDDAGLPASQVELEITETVFLGDGTRAVSILAEFKALGFRLAMDDFGTGYSSLSYLRRFPLDIIKIDRSLVTGLEQEEEVAMIARAAISLGKSLHKTVVAEGVENLPQFDYLRRYGCDEFQGYLLSRPLPAEQLTALLEGGGTIEL